MSEAAERDAKNCADYLAGLRDDPERGRFKVGVDDFLMRNSGQQLSLGTLRQILADAYLAAAPDDVAGHQQIIEPMP